MTRPKDSELIELINFVRSHQTYKGERLKDTTVYVKNVSDWLEAIELSSGPNPVKGYALYSMYKTWCKENNIEDVAVSQTFHKNLEYVLTAKTSKRRNNRIYYVNKKLQHVKKEEKITQE